LIVTRSPLRISIGGGGTDLASYYTKFGGYLISAAIDKYVYITINDRFVDELLVKYTKLEDVKTIGLLKHTIVKEALYSLGYTALDSPNMEIVSIADIPSGTGLGSSGSFTTALLKALYQHSGKLIHPKDLAELACNIEIDKLGAPIGKQDQYIAAFGGITCFTFNPDHTVIAEPLQISKETLYNLEDNLMLFFTGYTHIAGDVLAEQNTKSMCYDKDMIENLHTVKAMGYEAQGYLLSGDLPKYAELLNRHWEIKKHRSTSMTNSEIDRYYNIAMQSGAIGGKLVGSGAGGFLLFYSEQHSKLRKALAQEGLKEVRMRFDFEGTKVITS
jgi:D-glycero-alpha-D-manno-heptose-7-phosphate kinase